MDNTKIYIPYHNYRNKYALIIIFLHNYLFGFIIGHFCDKYRPRFFYCNSFYQLAKKIRLVKENGIHTAHVKLVSK